MRILPILLALASVASATDRFFGDSTAKSPNGKFRLEAKSPDNEEGRRAFAANFEYTLFDESTGKAVWTRKQPMKKDVDWPTPDGEGSPSGVWLDDDGRAVVFTGWQELFVLEPTAGQKVFQGKILEQFPEGDRKKFVSQTTAGPMWTGNSLWYFLGTEGEAGRKNRYFVVRPWWGDRVFLDLETPKFLPDAEEGEAVRVAADKHDRDYVKEALADVRDLPECGAPGGCGRRHEVDRAAWLAGVLDVREAIGPLRALESDTNVNSSTMVPDGFSYQTFGTRQTVQLALRRLGQAPEGGGSIVIRFEEDPAAGKPVTPAVEVGAKARVGKVGDVKEGMSAREIVALIGNPDCVSERGSFAWDIDGEKPFTLVVAFKEGKVGSIRKIDPPDWKAGLARDALLSR
ncbi:MAG: hypothetical protein HYY18_13020 [Planctomycetes bacterium]|nr:hypothetical protein [Planctomycetota bacterium]